MPDPTLADVLAALETEEPVDFAFTARRYFEVNRTALERMEWERAVRRFIGESYSNMNPAPMLVVSGNCAPVVDEIGPNVDAIVVGANWKPEAGR